MEKLALLDGNSLLNRAYYATPPFTTKDGFFTNGIFGFVKFIIKIIQDLKPEYMIVAFDLKEKTFRHKLYADYKGTRKEMPEELAVQIEPLKNLLSAMNVSMCSMAGYEADDIIGTLSKKFNVHSYIYTGDKDSFQLVSDKCDVFFTKHGVSDLTKLSINNFKDVCGIDPYQIIDLKALMGDKSDNILGVSGVGEKSAMKLLQSYNTLNGIYEHIDEICGSLKNKLIDKKEDAYLSYTLATIKTDCEIDIDLNSCKTPKKFGDEVKKIFLQLEFKSLLGLDMFVEDKVEKPTDPLPEIVKCDSYDDFLKSAGAYSEFSAIKKGATLQVFAGGKLYNLTCSDNLFGDGINFEDYEKILNRIYGEKNNRVLSFNYKSQLHELEAEGVKAVCDFDDLALLSYIQGGAVDLKELCLSRGYDEKYSAFAIKVIFDELKLKAEQEGTLNIYTEIEKPLLTVLFEMENTGVKVSAEKLGELSKNYIELSDKCKQKVFSACGKEFNLNSPSQLGEMLSTNLGITELKKNKGKISTSADVLEKLKDKYPVIENVLKYRQYQKLCSTYIEGVRSAVKNSFVHTTFNQTATATGRLSSANPNLQSIPIRESEGKEVRKAFLAREGNVLIDADYSQIELRLLAHFSGCKELIEAYNNGLDIHAITASQVFKVSLENVTPAMRRTAKAVNFGIIYGISDFGLASNLNISRANAKEYIDRYFASYSAVKDYMSSNVEFAKKHGFVSTITGRKRYINEIYSNNYNLRQFGERAAMNMPLQGSSADIIKIAMINIHKRLNSEKLNAKLILQVHDELVLDSPKDEAEASAAILKYEMENAVKLNVPLTVDVHIGENWYDAK